ncbi:MAG: lytic transglycosylase domain-containing protein [Deltaproteobacteria bacterium]|nr:lytic transglycosylase domain-containing protein [Deltaproteobacteria bacterium]
MARRPHLLWRALGALAERGSRLPPLAVGLVIFAGMPQAPVPPAPELASPPVPLNAPAPVPPAAPAISPEIAHLDEILARKAPGLGLEVRQQLAAALVMESHDAKLDPLLVLAVMRVESEFDEDALSDRGARGLMQLRPGTLAFLAKRDGIRLPIDEIQDDPVLSTRLAVRYLGRLVKSFHGDLDRALMAYNAGPHRLHVAVKARDTARLDRLSSYPRRVRRAWRHLESLPGTDDTAVAERGVDEPGTEAGE